MAGVIGAQHAAGRIRVVGIALATVVLLVIWTPAAARASGCTDSWETAKTGSWYTATNWSNGKVPTSSDEVCITVAGTYTVEMLQGANVSVKSLLVGGASGTQTLTVASTNSVNAILTTTSGITNGAHGAIALTNAETNPNSVTLVGPVTNAGLLTEEFGKGGARSIQGNVTNTGTVALNITTSFNGSKTTLTNEGALNLAAGTQLVVTSENSFINGTGGKITGTGSGNVQVEPGASFTEGAGTTSGTKPVIIRDAALHYTGSGASFIAIHGASSTISGNVSAGQSISIESVNSENTYLTAAASFSNAGAITLTSTEANPNQAGLIISSGTLTNSGSVKVEAGVGGLRYLEGSVTNNGTITINATTAYDGKAAALNNQGALNLATGTQLVVSSEGSVTNGAGGSITAAGSGNVQIEPGASFTEGAGTTSGTKPVIIRDAALHYTGSGASFIAIHGASSTISGNVSAGQSISIESVNSENTYLTAAASFSNAGAITLTSTEANPNQAGLIISSGTLTNSGSISIEAGVGGLRYLEGTVTNTGTITINQTTKDDAGGTLMNQGAIKLATGTQLIVTASGTVVNGAGGSIAAGENAAVAIEPGDTFTEGAGTTTGTKPVIVRDAVLNYTGSGSSTITTHGTGTTISGNVSSGQSLIVEATSSEHAYTTAAGSFSNAGTITLTSIEAPNQAALVITAGVLANTGSIKVESGVGGPRYLEGNITNTGSIAINAITKYDTSGAVLVNQGAIIIASGVQLLGSANPTISNESGGSITVTGTGTLLQTGGTFNQGLGKTTVSKSSEPVILDRVALHYTDKGASKLAERGAGTLSGTVNKGSTLSIESSCAEHATVTAPGSFLNAGTINLTNVESCANNVTLNLTGGTLENKGTINVLYPHGGVRLIEGSLLNEKTLSLSNESSQSLQVTGTYTQGAKASLKLTIAGATNFGRLKVTGGVVLAGKLSLKQSKFTGTAGESFGIITSSALSGTFASVTGNAIKGGSLHYVPHYTPTGVNLVVE